MPSLDDLDLDRILGPISDDSPVGSALDSDDPNSGYYRVKDAWSRAKNIERMNERNRSLGEPTEQADWNSVVSEAEKILTQESKDFRVACWLSDALMRLYGFQGLRVAMSLCRRLCENYWDTLYPLPDEDEGHSDRVTQFGALTSEGNVIALNTIPITDFGGEEEYTGATYMHAGELGKLSEAERDARIREGAVTYDQFKQGVDNTPVEFYVETIDTLTSTLEDLNATAMFLDEHCQPDSYGESTSPPVSAFREQLETTLRLISSLTADRRDVVSGDDDGDGDQNGLITTDTTVAGNQSAPPRSLKMSDGTPANREDALAAMQKIAEFFAKSEPHSLISFKIKQAVEWARMPLPDLLGELINDSNVMHDIQRRTGLPNRQGNDE